MRPIALPLALLTSAALCLTACNGKDDSASPANDAPPATTSTAPETAGTTEAGTPEQSPTDPLAAPGDVDPSFDVCALLAPDDLEPILGADQIAPVPVPLTCIYSNQVTASNFNTVQVFVGPGAQKQYQIDSGDLGHEFEDVDGVCDEAHLEEGWVFFAKDAVWGSVQITPLLDGWPGFKDDLLTLGQKICGLLPAPS